MKKQIIVSVIGALVILSLLLSLTTLTVLESLRIVFGSVYVLFLPGFVISFIFFKEIDWIERLALSFALSIAIVPLLTFYLNLMGLKISAISVSFTVLVIIIAGLAWLKWKK